MQTLRLSSTAVVIPCYRAANTVRYVISDVPEGIGRIYCVNDASPDNLAEVLALLNEWWDSEVIPEEALLARVVLIFKKGDKADEYFLQ